MLSVLSSPVSPDEMDWRRLFPAFYPKNDNKGTCKTADERSAKVEFADIGCGYGGLLGNLFSINAHITVLITFSQSWWLHCYFSVFRFNQIIVTN